MYEEWDVSDWEPAGIEQMGKKRKQWLYAPSPVASSPTKEDPRWLWKGRTENVAKGGDSYPKGDDWAERVACGLGQLLGVPVARVELAVRDGWLGTICLHLLEDMPGAQLRHGNELLDSDGPSPPSGLARNDPTYTLETVYNTLEGIRSPLPDDVRTTAADWFAGYLVLDAWMGNTDRHRQNWGAVEPADGSANELAASFDHASSLGFLLSDDAREEMLEVPLREHGSVEVWAERAPTPFADCSGPVEAAAQFLRRIPTDAAESWRQALAEASSGADGVLSSIPKHRMSEASKLFASRLLSHNAARIESALAPMMGT